MVGVAEWEAEVEVDEALARALIAAHYPALDSSSLRRIGVGWDNVVWATADGVAFRFPRREVAVAGVEREMAVLPELAPRLPVAIPDAAYPGEWDARFRWPWFGSRLVAGRDIAQANPDETQRITLAPALGVFLRRLHCLELPGAAALPIDPMGRTDMAIRVPRTREALARVASLWSPPTRASELLAQAEDLPPPRATALVHGDLHPRHVLVDERGTLVGVIDWGDICRADPGADLSLYWSLFTPIGRVAFLSAYGPVAEDRLLRARVLALFLCATLAAYADAQGMADLRREALRGLGRTLAG